MWAEFARRTSLSKGTISQICNPGAVFDRTRCTIPLRFKCNCCTLPGMTLNDYLTANGLTDADFADLIRRDRTTVLRWRRGTTQPDWSGLQAVLNATGGAVKPNDFLEPG